jgi:hypothetical protein
MTQHNMEYYSIAPSLPLRRALVILLIYAAWLGAVFKNLGTLQLTLVTEARLKRMQRPATIRTSRPATELTTGGSFYGGMQANSSMAAEADGLPVAQPAPSLDLSLEGFSWLTELADSTEQQLMTSAYAAVADSAVLAAAVAADGATADSSSSSRGSGSAWDVLRLQHGWPEGQSELESLYSPFDAEGIDACMTREEECSPAV